MTIHTPKVFRLLRDVVVWPRSGSPRTLPSGTLLWQFSSRRSSLGGYIGQFCLVYESPPGLYHPRQHAADFSINTDAVEAVA